jgi:FkbM family methyltransferase
MASKGHDPIVSMLYWHGSDGWEPETVDACIRLVAPGTTTIDVGANTGYLALCLALCEPRARVEAFEPVARVFAQLQVHRKLNRAGNLRCHQLALSDHSGSLELYIPDEPIPIMASMLDSWRPGSRRVTVATATIDEAMATGESWPVQLVKLDTEGTEDRVLRGAVAVIARDRPFFVCEILPVSGTSQRIEDFFRDHGYVFYRLGPTGPTHCTNLTESTQQWRNYLFAHESRQPELVAASRYR